MFFQLCILGYFVLVLIHFCIFAYVKPKVRNYRRTHKLLRCFYGAIWLLILIFVMLMQIGTFIIAYQITLYNTRWLDVLEEN